MVSLDSAGLDEKEARRTRRVVDLAFLAVLVSSLAFAVGLAMLIATP